MYIIIIPDNKNSSKMFIIYLLLWDDLVIEVFEEPQLSHFIIFKLIIRGWSLCSFPVPTFSSFVLSEETDCCVHTTPHIVTKSPAGWFITVHDLAHHFGVICKLWAALGTSTTCIWSHLFHKGKIWPVTIMTGDGDNDMHDNGEKPVL